jgi:hypothetical protein
MRNRVAYVYSYELERLGNIGTHPAGRSNRVHSLAKSLDLFDTSDEASDDKPDLRPEEKVVPSKATVVVPRLATDVDLRRYHSKEFVGEPSCNATLPCQSLNSYPMFTDFLLYSEQTEKRPTETDSEDFSSDTGSEASEASTSHSYDSRPSKKRRVQQTPADRFGLKDVRRSVRFEDAEPPAMFT